ncbi:MAG: molecular chaperone TorD family protein [Proteobacteria bacterium]|nr:molecular chaperone TorD family protein [Pseudomonadota bacterium]
MILASKEYGILYGLIGRFLLVELDSAAVEALRSQDIISVLDKLQPGCESYLSRHWTDEDYDDAAAEYCALFVLPGKVPLIASYWIPGATEEIGHQLVAGVREVLQRFALSVAALHTGNVPGDHVGLLSLLAAYLYQQDDPLAAQHGRDFVETFVSPWVPAFTGALLAKTENPFYRALGHLLAQLIRTV